ALNVPEYVNNWSTNVVFPWSTCAIIAMLRISSLNFMRVRSSIYQNLLLVYHMSRVIFINTPFIFIIFLFWLWITLYIFNITDVFVAIRIHFIITITIAIEIGRSF